MKRTTRRCWGWSVSGRAVVALLLIATAIPARGQSNLAGRPPIEPKADQLFAKMSAHLAAARQFSFESRSMVDRVLESGLRLQFSRRAQVVARRPNAIAATAVGDIEEISMWYQGTKLTLLDRRANTYAQVKVPDTIDEMFDYMAARHGFIVPLCDLLFSDPYKAAMEQVHTSVYVGLHDVDGVKCHHLAFRQDGADWQIWIQDGDQPLPRKIVITYKNLPGTPQFIAFLDMWNLSDRQPESVFEFKPPPDASQVEMPVVSEPVGAPSESGAPARRGD
jgi:hypothetical protein